jgi:hypothetical protein
MEVPGSSVGKKQGVDEMREKIGVTLPLYVLYRHMFESANRQLKTHSSDPTCWVIRPFVVLLLYV